MLQSFGPFYCHEQVALNVLSLMLTSLMFVAVLNFDCVQSATVESEVKFDDFWCRRFVCVFVNSFDSKFKHSTGLSFAWLVCHHKF